MAPVIRLPVLLSCGRVDEPELEIACCVAFACRRRPASTLLDRAMSMLLLLLSDPPLFSFSAAAGESANHLLLPPFSMEKYNALPSPVRITLGNVPRHSLRMELGVDRI